jgi:hypothetical protein
MENIYVLFVGSVGSSVSIVSGNGLDDQEKEVRAPKVEKEFFL